MTDRQTQSAHVAASIQRAIAAGGRRVNLVMRDPDAVAALARGEKLHGSATAAIVAALSSAFPKPRKAP